MADETASRDESVTALDASAVGGVADARAIAAGSVLASRYEVRRVLGRGGMGVVVVAHDRTLGTDVAIKLLRPELTGERRWAERLAREVKLARQIRHANVCRVFDFVQADGRVFIVMELAVGTLRAEMEGGLWLGRSTEERLADVRAVVAGLAAIHEAAIVHRDVTTQNVLRLADGRLVVSDFGLATDAGETTASIQGGTVAYMAPELGVGGRASFASDVWALGIVIHELVFGRRPTWRSEEARRGIERPERKLAPVERAMFEICRACTGAGPADRPTDAGAVARLLEEVAGHRTRRCASGFATVVTAVVALAMAGWAGAKAYHRWGVTRQVASSTDVELPVEITGVPSDWTDSSRVLAAVEGRIHCLVALPDKRTLRFVWGLPRQAEDVDIQTGVRRPSRLVPEAYAEGCPDLSPNGRDLIFQSHDQAGHPVVLKSVHPDGSDASVIAASVEPDGNSNPRWVGNGAAMAVSVDASHLGIVDSVTGRLLIVPDFARDVGSEGIWGWIVGGDHIITAILEPTNFGRIRVRQFPSLRLEGQITILGPMFYDGLIRGHAFYLSGREKDGLVAVDWMNHRASRIGAVPGQGVTWLAAQADGIGFVSRRYSVDAWVRSESHGMELLTHDGSTEEVADCGPRGFLVVKRNKANNLGTVVGLHRSGESEILMTGEMLASVACSKTTSAWWVVRLDLGRTQILKCGARGACKTIREGMARRISLSPDESRLAFNYPSNQGAHVAWIPSEGGATHEVSDSETTCGAGWSSNSALWVSRRIGARFVWTEVDVENRAETGRTTAGSWDCSDGDHDRLSPIERDLTTITAFTSQVRFKSLP